jgi:hypothetical protein
VPFVTKVSLFFFFNFCAVTLFLIMLRMCMRFAELLVKLLYFQACEVLSKPQKSLAYLLELYCGVTTDKTMQASNLSCLA